MKRPSQPTVVIGIVVAALALASWGGWAWWHRHFEKVTVERNAPPSAEVLDDDLLAAARTLRAMGTTVRSFRSVAALDSLPPVTATLILPETHYPISAREVGSLLGWVRAGGHLVVAINSSESDPMQDSLGLSLGNSDDDVDSTADVPDETVIDTAETSVEPDLEPFEFPDSWGKPPAAADSAAADTAAIVIDTAAIRAKVDELFSGSERKQKLRLSLGHLPALPDSLWIGFGSLYWLRQTDSLARPVEWRFPGGYGPHLARLKLGRGRVTVLSDAYWMQNDALGDNDHAPLLWALTHEPGHERGPVWFVRDTEAPSVSGWLARFAWPLLVSMLALIAAWWARSARRFGPLHPAPDRVRRRLIEHLEASGQFLWSHRQSAALLGAVRNATLRRLDRRQPGWSRLAPDDLSLRLGRQIGLPPPAVRAALFSPADKLTGDDFTRHVRILETIRRTL